jgi:integrase
MKNNGMSDHTIRNNRKLLDYLEKNTDLNNPEQVKRFIASLETSNSYRRNLSYAYNKFCRYYNLEWTPPKYRQEPRAIRIPTTAQIESLIANSGRVMSVKLSLSKETGLRPIELCNLKVKDIDLEQRTVYPTTAKHGAPRKLIISNSLTQMLKTHIDTHDLKLTDKLFKGDSANYGKHYRLHRNKLAKRLHKPELKTIRLYDFRHYFATRLYAKTRDILLVKQKLGHKKIETTLIYTQLLETNEDEEYTCRTATNVKESKALIETGFEYVTEQDGFKLFRKRK